MATDSVMQPGYIISHKLVSLKKKKDDEICLSN
jgi:hypothetical protein